jgi:hypothetical protein
MPHDHPVAGQQLRRHVFDPFGRPREVDGPGSSVERQIQEAMDEGAFDNLPFHGEPLPLDDDSAAGEWALAYRMLRGAGFAPPWIEADKEVRRLLAQRDAIVARSSSAGRPGRRRDREELVRVVEAVNRAIARLNTEAPTERQHRRPLDLETELARLG